MKKLFSMYASMALLFFQSCNEREESFPKMQSPAENFSCDCALELYSKEPGETKSFGYGDHPLLVQRYDNLHVFEGDIVLSDEQIVIMTATEGDHETGRTASAGRARVANRWPNGIVPYVINAALPNQQRVTNAIAHWEALTDYDFVPRTSQANYVEFVPSNGCASAVGMIGGRQFIYLASGCTAGNTIHEIGHAVGLWHEHTRADRDYFVNINWNNIIPEFSSNFKYYNLNVSGFDRGTFDFGSIMMYPSDAASNNGQPTITRKDGSTFTAQRDALSTTDVSGAAYIYNAVDLPAPNNIVASHDGDEELTVTWSPVSGANQYWVYTYLSSNEGPINEPRFYRITSTAQYTRELKLKYRDSYRIWISSRDANGNTSALREATYTWK